MSSKVICFYLPQFYEFEENNRWWGKGFTEWTNVKKSTPLFKGHYQPTIPLNKNYYSLEKKETFRWQIDLAKKYGVYGFCFYHYYFGNGKYLMQKPIEMFLNNKDLDINFCLCWANHTWSRTWTGAEQDILMKVEYDQEEATLKEYFNYLKFFFLDDRYIKINNKPIFIIYVPEQIPDLAWMKELFTKWAKEIGFDGVVFASQNTEVALNREKYRDYIEYSIYYEPNYSLRRYRELRNHREYFQLIKEFPLMTFDRIKKKILRDIFHKTSPEYRLEIINYSTIWRKILNRNYSNEYWPGGFVNVDTSPRKGYNGLVTIGATTNMFKKYMTSLLRKCSDSPFVFLMAWNEWGEGAYLEPDELHGYAYLEALKNAIEESKSL